MTDSNTINRIIDSFGKDATRYSDSVEGLVELGPGPGALTQVLLDRYSTSDFRCVEIDQRAVEVLKEVRQDAYRSTCKRAFFRPPPPPAATHTSV